MMSLIYALAGLNWDRHLDPSFPTDAETIKKQHLEKPEREIILADKDGKELARLGQAGEDERHTFIRRGVKEYYAVDKMRYASVRSSIEGIMGDIDKEKK